MYEGTNLNIDAASNLKTKNVPQAIHCNIIFFVRVGELSISIYQKMYLSNLLNKTDNNYELLKI